MHGRCIRKEAAVTVADSIITPKKPERTYTRKKTHSVTPPTSRTRSVCVYIIERKCVCWCTYVATDNQRAPCVYYTALHCSSGPSATATIINMEKSLPLNTADDKKNERNQQRVCAYADEKRIMIYVILLQSLSSRSRSRSSKASIFTASPRPPPRRVLLLVGAINARIVCMQKNK